MEQTATAPPVVAVIVVHRPGPWFDEVLDGLAEQDYPNLRCLFLVAGDTESIPERVRARVAGAFVRGVDGNPGFGVAANEVSRLVEGENGLFCFLHDDVVLDPSAIRLLVEELFRSNAGVVGPKVVEWDDPTALQSVGLGVDRFGEVDPSVEPGEVDQEQHDAVRDVFAVPSSCMLVRADLFRAIGGFSPAIDFHGEDVELCWRAQLSGARVLVVPAARVRHRQRLVERRPDLAHERLRARHRVRTVASLTGRARLPLRMVQMLLLAVVELVVGTFTGKARQGAASLGALVGLVPGIGSVASRRRAIGELRQVPDGEVAGLHVHGSARLASYRRHRDLRVLDADELTARRWRQSAGSAPAVAWLSFFLFVAIGSRLLLRDGVPSIGEFLPFPDRPRSLIGDVRSGWVGQGLGHSEAAPLGLGLIGLASIATLFNMGLLHTLGVVGLFIVGGAGMWAVGSLFPTARARIVGLAVYAAVPLPSHLTSTGRWGALAVYAATPWVVHWSRRLAGVGSDSLGEAVESEFDAPLRQRLRDGGRLILMVAVVTAFSPSFALIAAGIGVVLGLSTLVARGSLRAASAFVAVGLTAGLVALLLHMPWTMTLTEQGGWTSIVGVPPVTAHSRGLLELASFGLGVGRFAPVAVVLYLPVLAAMVLARGWRQTWAIRAGGLVIVFGWLAVLDDRGSLPIRLPEPGVLLAPVALGVAIAAACLAAAFQDDVLSGSFGWRQPLGLLAAAAVAVGLFPGAFAAIDGRWNAPERTLVRAQQQFFADTTSGDYRVLWIGDPDLMPVGAWALRPGLAYGISNSGSLTITDRFVGPPSDAEQAVGDVVNLLGTAQAFDSSTQHIGRLLAPFGVRYIAIPVADGALATIDSAVEPPSGLVESLDRQLDLAQPLTRPLNLLIYENTAWAPTRATLTAAGAEASRSASLADLAQTDLAGATPYAVGASPRGPMAGEVAPGTLHIAAPYDERWTLDVGGTTLQPRPAFGSTMAFDVTTGGRAELSYSTPSSRTAVLALLALAWLALLVLASRLEWSTISGRWSRRRPAAAAPVLEMGGQPLPTIARRVEVPWREDDGAADSAGFGRSRSLFETGDDPPIGGRGAAAVDHDHDGDGDGDGDDAIVTQPEPDQVAFGADDGDVAEDDR